MYVLVVCFVCWWLLHSFGSLFGFAVCFVVGYLLFVLVFSVCVAFDCCVWHLPVCVPFGLLRLVTVFVVNLCVVYDWLARWFVCFLLVTLRCCCLFVFCGWCSASF